MYSGEVRTQSVWRVLRAAAYRFAPLQDDAYDGCYGIELWSGGRPTFVDRRSLLPRYAITLTGLASRAEINGTSSVIEGWDDVRGRFEVALEDKSRIRVQPSNVVLPVNARVRIHGLVSAAHLNGRLARIVGIEGERYDVEFVDAKGSTTRVRLKRENARL